MPCGRVPCVRVPCGRVPCGRVPCRKHNSPAEQLVLCLVARRLGDQSYTDWYIEDCVILQGFSVH